MKNTYNQYLFLQGGGEMGELIRTYNWEQTPVGPIETWPLSLRTTLGIILKSAFPMLIFWGDDFIVFYNDAYIKTLQQKHPVLGYCAKDIWPEAWPSVKPMLDIVYNTGKPISFENLLIPIQRNDTTEDVYWSFSYSPAYGDDGQIAGVFVSCYETTENVEVITKLTESRDELEFAIEATELGIWDVNPLTNTLKANKRLREWFGLAADDEMFLTWATDVIVEEDRERVLNAINYALTYESGGKYEIEYAINNPVTKVRRVVRAKGRTWFNEDKVAYRFNGTLQDVTEQHIATQKLKESEQQVRAVIDSAPFPIGVYIGREMKIVLANQAIIDVWDRGTDIIGKTYFEVLPELENQNIYPKLLEVYDTGVPYHVRNERVDLLFEGKLQSFYFNYSFTPLFDAQGKVYGVMNTAAEVTDLNVAKQKVEQSELNFRNMILQAPVAMCILLGPEHVVDIANDMMLEIWGKPVEDVMHKPIFEGLPDAREQGLEQLLDNVYQTGKTFSANEMPVKLLRNGKTDIVYQNFVYEPYLDASGTILGVLAISIDVSPQVIARHKIEEVVKERTTELEIANTNLQRSNAELAQFAYIASHDLQEPVRKISIFAQMLGNRINDVLDEASQTYLNKISDSAERMQTLIRDVLTYSELVKKADIFTTVDLNDIAAGTVTDYELLIEQKQATVTFEKLPVVEAIPLQMSQLFGNLVSNALKYSKPDVKPEIIISVTEIFPDFISSENKTNQYYRLDFKDNGIGFDDLYAEKIFNIFQRLHGKTEFTGTGIGLAICKKIVQNHHGTISASSTEGKGATFSIILPAKQEEIV